MRITLKFPGNVYNLMRQAGYHPHETGNEKTSQASFARRLGTADYPRFHIYLKVARETLRPGSVQAPQEVVINIHLDQKKPIYKGTVAHSGEYEGELVEKEAERIKKVVVD